MAAYLKNDLGLFDNMPWGVARRDVRGAARLLIHAGIDRTSALGAEVLAMLCQRASECRDLFVLRGARARTITVLQMAGRSLARDAEQAARLDVFAAGQGRSLLRALSCLIEQIAAHGPPSAKQRKPATVRPAAPVVRTASVQTDRTEVASPVMEEIMSRKARPVRSPANDDAPAQKRHFAAA